MQAVYDCNRSQAGCKRHIKICGHVLAAAEIAPPPHRRACVSWRDISQGNDCRQSATCGAFFNAPII